MSSIGRKIQRNQQRNIRKIRADDARRSDLHLPDYEPDIPPRDPRGDPMEGVAPPSGDTAEISVDDPRHPWSNAHMRALMERMEPHAVYDRGDPQAEGRRGWMSHPRGAPNRADKGLRDGSCNRTACQDVLAGQLPRWSMHNHGFTEGNRLYYCTTCAEDFTKWDLQSGDPVRCSVYPGDES